MKVFFDTNVYVAEALLGGMASRIVDASHNARWRIVCSEYVLDETERVIAEKLGMSRRLAALTRDRMRRRAVVTKLPASRHQVPGDAGDSPILAAAIASGVDVLVSNDRHLLALDPYQSLRIVSMSAYHQLLIDNGLLPAS
jgi:putative PIN family toxin of toxin-antitoxin system